MPSGRCLPLALGIYTRRTGRGCQDARLWCTRTATAILDRESSATSRSAPAVARPALRWVTCRTLTSVLLHDRSIIFCRLLTWGQSPSRVALKILCRSLATLRSWARQSTASHSSSPSVRSPSWVPNLPFGSVSCTGVSLQRLTWLASAPFWARHLPVSGRLSTTPPQREDGTPAVVSRCLSAAGFASRPSCPAWYSAPLMIGLPALTHRTMTGFPRSAHARYGRIGRPLYPGTSGAPASQVQSPARRLPHHNGKGPVPRHRNHHLSGAAASRDINQGFTRVRPPGLPLTRGPRMTRAPSGFTPGFAPARAGPAHARQGRDRL